MLAVIRNIKITRICRECARLSFWIPHTGIGPGFISPIPPRLLISWLWVILLIEIVSATTIVALQSLRRIVVGADSKVVSFFVQPDLAMCKIAQVNHYFFAAA